MYLKNKWYFHLEHRAKLWTKKNSPQQVDRVVNKTRRRPLTGTKLYCLVTEADVCEQLAQGCYLKAQRPGVERATF